MLILGVRFILYYMSHANNHNTSDTSHISQSVIISRDIIGRCGLDIEEILRTNTDSTSWQSRDLGCQCPLSVLTPKIVPVLF
jgi:hypothetical protein